MGLCADGNGRTFAYLDHPNGQRPIAGEWSRTIEAALVSLAEKLRTWVSEVEARPWGSLEENDRTLYAWARRFVG